MHTIINSRRSARRPRLAQAVETFRQPSYDCRDNADTMTLSVYVPGVDAAGVDIGNADAVRYHIFHQLGAGRAVISDDRRGAFHGR
jgi:hypothetical protein